MAGDPSDEVGGVEHPLDERTPAPLAEMLAYWEGRREGRLAPARRDIDPCDFPRLLPLVSLVDVIRDPLDFRIRLAGTGLAQLHGFEGTGRQVRDIAPPAYAELLWQHYRHVTEVRRPALFEVWMRRERRRMAYWRLSLPLSDDGALVTMILNCAVGLDGPASARAVARGDA